MPDWTDTPYRMTDWHLIWVWSWRCGCLVTWFCYQLIAKPGNMTAESPWLNPYCFCFVYVFFSPLNQSLKHWYETTAVRLTPFIHRVPIQLTIYAYACMCNMMTFCHGNVFCIIRPLLWEFQKGCLLMQGLDALVVLFCFVLHFCGFFRGGVGWDCCYRTSC